VACVEHDQIGIGAIGGGNITLHPQHLRHAFAVIDVHLAAEGFDVEGLGGIFGGGVGCHRRPIGDGG
jgi:hypothetical protein